MAAAERHRAADDVVRWRRVMPRNALSPRECLQFTAIGDRIYCFGGTSGAAWFGDVHVWDPERVEWMSLHEAAKPGGEGVTPSPRSAHSQAQLADQRIWMFGGWNGLVEMDDVLVLDVGERRGICNGVVLENVIFTFRRRFRTLGEVEKREWSMCSPLSCHCAVGRPYLPFWRLRWATMAK